MPKENRLNNAIVRSHRDRIRSAITPFSQIDFSYVERLSDVIFTNLLTGESRVVHGGTNTLSDNKAAYIADELQISDDALHALMSQMHIDTERLRAAMRQSLEADRHDPSFLDMATRYQDLMDRLPRISAYLNSN